MLFSGLMGLGAPQTWGRNSNHMNCNIMQFLLFLNSEDQILLSLRCRDFKGDYDVEVPLLWDTSEGATARKLKSCIASHIGCDIANLCIAKLHHNQQEWRMIKITKPTHNKKVDFICVPFCRFCGLRSEHLLEQGCLDGWKSNIGNCR